MPVNSKVKGASGERELLGLLTGWAHLAGFKLDLVRNLEQSRGGGYDLTGLEEFGMAVEVKRVEARAINQWWQQAVRQAAGGPVPGLTPVLAHRANRQPWRFRVRVWVYPCKVPLDTDMDADVFRQWFVHQLKHYAKETA